MKKIFFILIPLILFILLPANNQIKQNRKTNIQHLEAKISYANSKDKTYTWSQALENNLVLGGCTIRFDLSYVGMTTYDSNYCSLYFDTQVEGYDFVIDIQATNYPIYTFTNRYEENIFATQDALYTGYVEYLFPEDITYISHYEFTKTSMGEGLSDDEVIDNLVTFVEPYVIPTIEITYEVLPKEANNKSVELDLRWNSSEVNDDISNYLAISHNETTCTILITNHQKANNQVILRITSIDNKEVYKDVTIDFEQEFLGFSSTKVSLSKDLLLEENEAIISEEEIKNAILEKSNGFLGTIPIESKEISNFNLSVTSTFIYLDGSSSAYIKNNTTYKNAYAGARTNNNYSIGFVDDIVENYFPKLSTFQAKRIKDSTSLAFSSICTANFIYYGQEFSFTVNLKETIKSSYLIDSLSLDVENISSNKNSIIF